MFKKISGVDEETARSRQVVSKDSMVQYLEHLRAKKEEYHGYKR